jgi:hypothetical protein
MKRVNCFFNEAYEPLMNHSGHSGADWRNWGAQYLMGDNLKVVLA